MAFAAQDWFEEKYISLLKEVALTNEKLGILLIPRRNKESDYKKYDLPFNIFFADWLSTYEKIVLSDFHSTIYSTTVHEATALGKRSILLNIDNLSKEHLIHDYPEGNDIVLYANDSDEFNERFEYLIGIIDTAFEMNENMFKPNFRSNLKSFISKNLHN
jgi:hypothetical protein